MRAVLKEILRDYERNQLKSQKILAEKQKKVYKQIPRIQTIDDKLNETGFTVVKQILNNDDNGAELIKNLEISNNKLLQERADLLAENGYDSKYFTDIYTCNICKDTGYVNTEKCRCFEQKLIDKYYSLSNLRNVLTFENFDTFDERYYSDIIDKEHGNSPKNNINDIFRKCMSFASNFERKYDNILFYGNTGIGKTFLCNCIAKDVLDKGHTVLYLTAPQLFGALEDYRFNRDSLESPDEYIDTIYNAELLIIDDLGSEVSTIVTSSGLYDIINSRILSQKHTIISTNLHPNNFEDQYSDRLTSRLLGYSQVMKFFGDDIRIIKKYKT